MNIAALQSVLEDTRRELAVLINRHGGRNRAKRIGAYPTIKMVAREARMLRRSIARRSLKGWDPR